MSRFVSEVPRLVQNVTTFDADVVRTNSQTDGPPIKVLKFSVPTWQAYLLLMSHHLLGSRWLQTVAWGLLRVIIGSLHE